MIYRCLLAEQILSEFHGPCKFGYNGCGFFGPKDAVVSHEAECNFRYLCLK
jgi:hypothetical protein